MSRRRNPPTDPAPTEYGESVSPAEMRELPPKNLYGQDLKKLKSYRLLRKNFKMKEIKSAFIDDVRVILDNLDPSDINKFDSELLIAILNLSEQFFLYPRNKEEREKLKLESVVELMLPFFDNNEAFLLSTIGNVMGKVKKLNVIRRIWARSKMFFRT
jgi:hypothetical protein